MTRRGLVAVAVVAAAGACSPGATACGARSVSVGDDAGGEIDAAASDARNEAGATADGGSDAGQELVTCTNQNDCIGVPGSCQDGVCCNGTVEAGVCQCVAGVPCDVTTHCCATDAGPQCLPMCPGECWGCPPGM
jgi:hypothetical protein